jgi:hypothetical protein
VAVGAARADTPLAFARGAGRRPYLPPQQVNLCRDLASARQAHAHRHHGHADRSRHDELRVTFDTTALGLTT